MVDLLLLVRVQQERSQLQARPRRRRRSWWPLEDEPCLRRAGGRLPGLCVHGQVAKHEMGASTVVVVAAVVACGYNLLATPTQTGPNRAPAKQPLSPGHMARVLTVPSAAPWRAPPKRAAKASAGGAQRGTYKYKLQLSLVSDWLLHMLASWSAEGHGRVPVDLRHAVDDPDHAQQHSIHCPGIGRCDS